MPPGKASRVPSPRRFRITAASAATATAYPGPSITALSTLIMCWAGKHLEMPTGMKMGDRATAMATKMTARATFRVSMQDSFTLRVSTKEKPRFPRESGTSKPAPHKNGLRAGAFGSLCPCHFPTLVLPRSGSKGRKILSATKYFRNIY